ncbi:MAG: hypothetical protein IPM98_18335 [Lewinellaceae bacterium]|nr:hypothetical protein [Lewinellaceae bacterium]
MKKQPLFLLLTLASVALLFSNCASLTGFQDGRSVGQNNVELSASINFSQSPDFDDWEDQNDTSGIDIPTLFFPSFEFGVRYGVAEKVDISLRMNTNLNLGLGAKFQVVGDRESQFAMALGAEVGTFGLVSGLWNVQIPLFLSVHPKENFAWYLNPRYIYQFTTYTGAENGLSYIGGNTGLLFGKRNKFGLDIGYYNIGTNGERRRPANWLRRAVSHRRQLVFGNELSTLLDSFHFTAEARSFNNLIIKKLCASAVKFFYTSRITNPSSSCAARAITVPGPKTAATPALFKKA